MKCGFSILTIRDTLLQWPMAHGMFSLTGDFILSLQYASEGAWFSHSELLANSHFHRYTYTMLLEQGCK